MYQLTQSKGGISSLELGRRLGVTQNTAWKLKHKLMQVMMERDAGKRLTGRVEMDDAYLGGERSGGKRGRGAPGKTPIIATVETTPEGKPVRLKLRRINGFRRKEVEKLARRSLDPGSNVVSDGLACFRGVTDAGCTHQPIHTGSGRKAALAPAFKWVNTALGNIKTAITATYRAIRQKHVPRYAAPDDADGRGSDGNADIGYAGCAADCWSDHDQGAQRQARHELFASRRSAPDQANERCAPAGRATLAVLDRTIARPANSAQWCHAAGRSLGIHRLLAQSERAG